MESVLALHFRKYGDVARKWNSAPIASQSRPYYDVRIAATALPLNDVSYLNDICILATFIGRYLVVFTKKSQNSTR